MISYKKRSEIDTGWHLDLRGWVCVADALGIEAVENLCAIVGSAIGLIEDHYPRGIRPAPVMLFECPRAIENHQWRVEGSDIWIQIAGTLR